MFSFIRKWRAKRSLARYQKIKEMVVDQHLKGFGGMPITISLSREDMAMFKPPMYFWAKDFRGRTCLFWRKDLMTEEVGPPKVASVKPTQQEAKQEIKQALAIVKDPPPDEPA